MSYGSGAQKFSSNEKVELSLKTALQRVQTDLERKWFNEPNSFDPKTPQENFRFNVPNYNEIKDYLLIDPNVDGEGTSMITNVTVANFLGINDNGALFTLANIQSGLGDKCRSETSLTNANLRNYVDGTNGKQIKGLGPNMFTRYSYYKGIENNGSTSYFAGRKWKSDEQDIEEPFNSIINLKGNNTTEADSQRNIGFIQGSLGNPDAISTKFYNNVISAAVPISIIKPPTDWNSVDVTKSHPFIKVYIQVPTYASAVELNSDNIAFTNPVLKSGLGDTYGYQYFISGWNGSKYEKLTTLANEFLFYNSTAGIITVYGQSDPINGTRMSQKYPPMVSFIRYTGETLGDGIISQGPTLPAPELLNNKDLFINTSENTIHRLKDDGVNKEWISIGGSGNSDISFNDTKPSSVPDDFEENQLFVDTTNNIIFRVDDNNGNKSFKQINEKILSGTTDPSGNKDGYINQLYIRTTVPPELYYNYGTSKQWARIGTGSGTSSSGTSGGTQPVDDQILTQTSEEIESVSNSQLLGTTNYTDILGSSKAYTFPVGSTSLIYRFRFNLTWNDISNRGDTISEYKLKITSNGTNWIDLKTFRLRNSVFSENFATIEHVIGKDDYSNITNIKLVGRSINPEFQQKIHYSYLTTPEVVKPILELVTLGTRTIQGAPLFSKKPNSDIFYTDGNVGIGSDHPQMKLTIGDFNNVASKTTGAIYDTLRLNVLTNMASSYHGIRWYDINNNFIMSAIRSSVGTEYNNCSLHFYTSKDKNTPTEKMRIDGDGNVNISKGNLTVSGNTTIEGALTTTGNTIFTGHVEIINGSIINTGKINLQYDNEINCNFGTKTLYLNYEGGNVKIGNSGTETTFHGPVTIGNNTSNTLLKISRTDQYPVSLYFGGYAQYGSITSDNHLSLKAGDDTGNGNAQSGQLFLHKDGNVGIGTINPKTKVYIKGDSLIINTENNAQNRVRGGRIFLAGHSGYTQACISGMDYRGGPSGTYKGGLVFYVYKDNNANNPGLDPLYGGNSTFASGSGMIEAIRIDNNGKVGIGTNNPSKKLHIAADSDDALLKIERTGSDSASLFLGGHAGWGNITSSTHLSLKAGDTTSNGQTYNNNPQLFLHKDGNVGIGTTVSNSKLHVFGGVSIGNIGAAADGSLKVAGSIACQTINATGTINATNTISFLSNHIKINQNDINPVGSHRLVINSTSKNNTLINPYTSGTSGAAGAKVLFGTNGSGKDEIPVQFHQTRAMSYKSNIVSFHDENSSTTDARAKIAEWSGSNDYNSGGNRNQTMGVYSVGNFWTEGAYVATSDKRIKENIREVDDSGALKKVRDISCVYYEYRDKLNKGYDTTIGFIAQQVREHLPLAISITTSEIPSVYKFIKDFTWETITDVSNNTKQKLHFNDDIDISSNAYYKFYTTNDLSANDLERNEFDLKCCEDDLKSFVFDQSWNYIFLYGEIVKDLHTLDKNKIFALNFSATQEIDKIQQQQLIDISGNTLNIAKKRNRYRVAQTRKQRAENRKCRPQNRARHIENTNDRRSFQIITPRK